MIFIDGENVLNHLGGKSPISGVESVTGSISPTIVANIVIANMIVTSEREILVLLLSTSQILLSSA